MGVRFRAQREHFITIRNGVIGHVQKPVCSHGSDLPGSEALGEIPAFPHHSFVSRLSIVLWGGTCLGHGQTKQTRPSQAKVLFEEPSYSENDKWAYKSIYFQKNKRAPLMSPKKTFLVIKYDVKKSASGCSCLCDNEITSHEFGKLQLLRAGNNTRLGSMRRKSRSSKTVTKP
jgi:hypothetical protein